MLPHSQHRASPRGIGPDKVAASVPLNHAGSKDTTLIIWDIVDMSRTGGRLRRSGPPGVSLQLQQSPRHVLTGHEDAITCLALSPELDLIVSAAADGTLLFHTLSIGRCFPLLCSLAAVFLALMTFAQAVGARCCS
jgi:WD40 repeat protein